MPTESPAPHAAGPAPNDRTDDLFRRIQIDMPESAIEILSERARRDRRTLREQIGFELEVALGLRPAPAAVVPETSGAA